MAATENTGLGHGTNGSPQGNIEEQAYPAQASANEAASSDSKPPVYDPSPKHEPGHNWGTENPIKSQEEGQHFLDTGYHDGKQVYNITGDGKLVKFQPDGTPNNGYHSYEVFSPPDIPPSVLKKMVDDGKISKSDYKKFLKGKKK